MFFIDIELISMIWEISFDDSGTCFPEQSGRTPVKPVVTFTIARHRHSYSQKLFFEEVVGFLKGP